MGEWQGEERREKKYTAFEVEVVGFMSRINEHMENQTKRCDAHSRDITALDARTTLLEGYKENAVGVGKALGIGLPALCSIGYAVFELVKAIK